MRARLSLRQCLKSSAQPPFHHMHYSLLAFVEKTGIIQISLHSGNHAQWEEIQSNHASVADDECWEVYWPEHSVFRQHRAMALEMKVEEWATPRKGKRKKEKEGPCSQELTHLCLISKRSKAWNADKWQSLSRFLCPSSNLPTVSQRYCTKLNKCWPPFHKSLLLKPHSGIFNIWSPVSQDVFL